MIALRHMLATARRRAPARDESGLTIVEVMVAGLLLVVGGIALLSTVDASTRATFRAEQGQVVSNQLQNDLETIKQLPFDEVAMTALPADSSDPQIPNSRMNGSNFAVNRNGTGLSQVVSNGSALEPTGTVSGGVVPPTDPASTSTGGAFPTSFESGDVSGTIYRYIVWRDDPNCSTALCPGTQDLKRVIVGVLLDNAPQNGSPVYQELQADIVDPDVTPVDNAAPPGGGGSKFWDFWLTDTPCNNNTRQPITGDHLSHNTLGICSDGLRTGWSLLSGGAPDLMFTQAPEIDENFPDDQQPQFDYATDVEPASGAGEDVGLQLRTPTSTISGGLGCLTDLGSLSGLLALGDDPQQLVHRWNSRPIPSGFEILLNGSGTLSLWTRTINGAVHPGKLCVYLYTTKLNILGQPVDTYAVNTSPTALDLTYFVGQRSSWPSGGWQVLQIPLSFTALNILPGERLGLAIAAERGGTVPGSGLEFMYDHPSFDSRLQVQTDSLLPLFNDD